MPLYKKAFDIGTYTGNGGQYRVGIPTLRLPGPSGKQVAGSLRFRSSNSEYMSRTPGSSGTTTKWTVCFWVKRGNIGASNYALFGAYSGASPTQVYFMSSTSDTLRWYENGGDYQTTLQFRDCSVWNHLVFSYDSTQATATDRMKIYLNGSQITSFSTQTTVSLNAASYWNRNNTNGIGTSWNTSGSIFAYHEGYMSEFYNIDGQALTPSSFGEYNSDGIWVPKSFSGTYGTNGFYLPMNSSSNYVTDQSGNGNNFTPSGFNVTTANTTYNIMTDSPTDYLSGSMTTANNAGNYCVFNPNDAYQTAGSWTFTNAGLYLTSGATLGRVRGTLGFSSGKWYWEVKYVNSNSAELAGISTATSLNAGGGSGGVGFYNTNGNIYVNGSASAYGTSGSAGDIIGVAVDMDNGKIWFSRNGTWQNSGDPAAGTNPGTTGLTGTYYPGFEDGASAQNATFEVNFGQRAFSYTPPTGFKTLNTYNISRPADSSLWFYGDTPDLIWFKNRSTSSSHVLADTVRGISLNSFSDLTQTENGFPYVMEMSKFGMSLQGGTGVNGSTNNHVYWAWKAGSNTTTSSVTNTDGFDTSQVSVNRQAGFSIVTYTGTGSNMSVGHGLGAAPNLIIIKSRNNTQNWTVYHSSVGTAKYLTLNSTATPTSAADYFTGVTSTLWSMTGAATTMATNGTTYIAYCWTAIPGYSAFGSYTGNGSSDGPFIYTGFRPRFILYKASSGIAYNWGIYDTTRDTYNGVVNNIAPNATTADTNYGIYFDILSNGFKARTGGGNNNDNGSTYIYAAFAEVPFKFARAR